MKKAGIITLFGEFNFGNRLQNYAVQETLKRFNLDVETIKYLGIHDGVASEATDIHRDRLSKFKKFNENIKFSKDIIYKEYDVPENFSDKYDYFVMGSDQIWNFTFDTIFAEKAFASFAPKSKKLSFSASFGVNYAPAEGTELYQMCQENLRSIKAISVREHAGKDIIEKLTGRTDAQVLIDPTMMLNHEDWEKVMKKPENLKTDKFIVKSFLGNSSDHSWKEIYRIAEENGCEIIDISDKNSPYYNMGPAEFLYLEKNAFLVATDSFHACVFSILFSTPFIVFERDDSALQSMYSRIETLLKTFKMENRIFDKTIDKSIFNSNYAEAHNILEKERSKVNEFLNKALM